MDDAMAIAASGLAAASASLTAGASNIANMETTGAVPATSPMQPLPANSGVYQPVSATTQALPGGGVAAAISNTPPSYTLAYDPSAPFANLQGMVAAPNVDLAAQAVNQLSSALAFRANLAVFQVASKDFKTLLDILA